MGVFENIYYSNFIAEEQRVNEAKSLDDNVFFRIYMSASRSSWKWGKLPKDMPTFKPEQYLQHVGMLGFTMKDGEPIILPIFPAGQIQRYGTFDRYIMIADNGDNIDVKAEDVEICYNNMFRLPTIGIVKYFADKSSNALNAVDTALERAAYGPIIGADNENSLKKLNDIIADGSERKKLIAVPNDPFNETEFNRIAIFDNQETDVLALFDIYTRYRNLFYTTIGINNVEIQKRERLTQAEGSGNDEIVRFTLFDDMTSQRTDFVKRVKEHFNYELSVEIERDTISVFQLSLSNEEKIENAKIEITKGANVPGQNTGNNGGEKDEAVQSE